MYTTLASLFPTLAPFDEWREAQSIFNRAATASPSHWMLPIRACEAVGGAPESAAQSALAVACAHISILLVDDMLDSDPRGEYQCLGMPAAANLASAFQSASLSALSLGIRDASRRQAALDAFNHMYLLTAYGQFLDAQAPSDEEAYWQVVRAKSAPFFGSVFQVGALAGGAALETARRLNILGRLYGEMIQVHDDLHDVMESPANPDWLQGRRPLPILFATLVSHPQQARFLELTSHIGEAGALEEAQDILFQCGAVSYCVEQLLQKHQAAQALLDGLSLAQPAALAELVEAVIAPVRGLLETVQ
ncbi:MAG: polyprenyl synthetase family protein [Chloroflexota bacterium]